MKKRKTFIPTWKEEVGGDRRRLGRGRSLSLILLALLFLAAEGDSTPRLGRLQSALIYRIPQFVTWPAGTLGENDAPFMICVYGEDPLGRGAILQSEMKKKRIHGRPVGVGTLANAKSARKWAEEAGVCHVLFVADDEDMGWRGIWSEDAATPTLILGDSPRILEQGGMMALVLRSGKIRIIANLENIRMSALKFDSRLMMLVREP